jgi:CHAT domain-containing protein
LEQKRLIIIGDGILQYLPFNALIAPQSEQPLIAQHEIINLPSASTLDAIRAQATKRQLAAKQIAILANPVFNLEDPRVYKPQSPAPTKQPATLGHTDSFDSTKRSRAATEAGFNFEPLPGTEREAQQILALVPETSQKKLAVGFDANRTTATSPELSQYRLVHFATHGFYNQENPELSGIVLSLVNQKGEPQKDGVLLVTDIFNLNLPTDLVVLSACRTIAGKEVKGEGIVGLTRGLIYAGAKRAVVSLWKVDDDATAAFMSRFYREILVNKQTPSAALRATQLWMQTETNWREPEYWSAFVLQGEW